MVQKGKSIIKFVFFINVASLLIILGCIMLTRTDVHNLFAKGNYRDISTNWYLDPELTRHADLAHLGQAMNPDSGKISVYSRVPRIDLDAYLIYRTKDVYSRVIIDGVQYYETTMPKSYFYNASPGNIWNRVLISSRNSGKLMQIDITMVYDTNAITLDHIYWGNDTDIILGMIREKTSALLISIFLYLIGIIFIFINLTVCCTQKKASPALFYLGAYALSIGIWSMIETNVLQFFVQDARILQLIDNMAMLVGNIPLFLYLDESHKILSHRMTRLLCYLDLAYISACIILQFIPGYDMHYLITGSAVFTLVFTAVYVCFFIRMAFTGLRQKRAAVIETRLQMGGLVILLLTTAAETIHFRYVETDGMDRAEDIRLAMLFLVIIWGISSQLHMIRLIKQGLQYDIVSRMAYTDILTELGNRTAYLERLQEFENNGATFGIVYLDINNLKTVNDTYGHENGDVLIRTAADVIRNSFGRKGLSYRIGGDEFCVLLDSRSCEQLYQESLRLFYKEIENKNKTSPRHLQLQIAHGFAVCRNATSEKVSASISEADTAMYKNKKELKASR